MPASSIIASALPFAGTRTGLMPHSLIYITALGSMSSARTRAELTDYTNSGGVSTNNPSSHGLTLLSLGAFAFLHPAWLLATNVATTDGC